MTKTKKTDKEATLRYVWLVTYRGRGVCEDECSDARTASSDAYEVYSTEQAALRAIASVLRLWCDDNGYIADEFYRLKLDTCLQRDAYFDALGIWNQYASTQHIPCDSYRVHLDEVEFNSTTRLNVKDDVHIRSCATDTNEDVESTDDEEPFDSDEFEHDTTYAFEKATVSSDTNPGYNKDGTHPWDDIFVAHDDGTHTCGPCTPKDIDISLDETQVWEVGSNGWIAPVVCRDCKLSIEVVVDGED